MKNILIIILFLFTLVSYSQPCDGNNGNNHGTGNNGNGHGNDPCNPVPLDNAIAILMVVGGGLGAWYTYRLKTNNPTKV